MTLKELSQLYYLRKQIEADQARLKSLANDIDDARERLEQMRDDVDGVASPAMDGMPHGSGGASQKVQDAVLRIMEKEDQIRQKRAAMLALETIISQRHTLCLMERARLETYISAIPDSLTRVIFTARFVDGLPWESVADAVGSNTVDSVKKTCYRYIRASDQTEKE